MMIYLRIYGEALEQAIGLTPSLYPSGCCSSGPPEPNPPSSLFGRNILRHFPSFFILDLTAP